MVKFMRRSRKFCQRGSNFDNVFFFFFFFFGGGGVDKGREDPNTTIINGPSSARQRNAINFRYHLYAFYGFFLWSRYRIEYLFRLINFNYFWICMIVLIFLGVYGRCWAQAYV